MREKGRIFLLELFIPLVQFWGLWDEGKRKNIFTRIIYPTGTILGIAGGEGKRKNIFTRIIYPTGTILGIVGSEGKRKNIFTGIIYPASTILRIAGR